ncbi:hypothetical protein [Paenibacillus sp. J2TS4]|uniref:hypothetical protein n=1 Tax=Paenibacillus sp. J2TS4 TaxID=2807194 RepID=UPI001BD042CF|nr:hypothetical protein [Paenibacillus sp. J2TS4]
MDNHKQVNVRPARSRCQSQSFNHGVESVDALWTAVQSVQRIGLDKTRPVCSGTSPGMEGAGHGAS